MRALKIMTITVVLTMLAAGTALAGKTLDKIKERGFINVGVSEGVAGFAMPDKKGVWRGLDIDTARAISCAVFGTPDKLKFMPLTSTARFTALQSGEVDVLCRNVTTTLSRETAMGINFGHVNFYDGQGFMVPKDLGVKSAKDLDGASICTLPGSTTELNVADYFRKNGMSFKPVVIRNQAALQEAFYGGRCDCVTSDTSQLAAMRVVSPNPKKYVILPEIISKEPLAPCVSHGDDQWYDIVNASVIALINAEELGITSKNVDEKLKSNDPVVKRFLKVSEGIAGAMGVNRDFAYNIIKNMGNYGEIFERNVGKNTPLALERGKNALWTKGGLMYGFPFK
ncbi:amino acid ABC transporter substrate-binding protein [Dethiosulfatarculus sandiegensis]|uniref:Amino acid ABC transporter substrate-binding protein n=1 Tax=Dethiosulfatarculus sandiegensis TaxID=1429043 RepID=A0A0D2J5X4_9BACT|nr:amino acid ABC transporter substrate-binding protein [Dethiosulfatarculus sandiegensis]KIX11106.1 amino acid ABC transporter substrate-binding protein [Dethiosulfatarculus sandiegensis]